MDAFDPNAPSIQRSHHKDVPEVTHLDRTYDPPAQVTERVQKPQTVGGKKSHMEGEPKAKKSSPWLDHVREVWESEKGSYKDALISAKKSYKSSSVKKIRTPKVPGEISPWIAHVMDTQAKESCSYKEAMKIASANWKK